ncbi:hypothetical protein AVEN_238595-1 [Araneus ventricosus]|uniref:Uncharacterized protein n=1 Tax=Araneus ventricosus TaxID=182803 RepID=A0A4Y2GP78_ARAVE|nr:hypothetical protein AVEN_238595-1 [Araneus ventricosus]
MHRRSIETTNQSATVHSDPLLRILPRFQNDNPACSNFFLRERAPLLSTRICTERISAFMSRHYRWSCWISRLAGNNNFCSPPLQFSSVFLHARQDLSWSSLIWVERSVRECSAEDFIADF